MKKLTTAEKEIVCKELAERMRDVVYFGADDQVRDLTIFSKVHEMPSSMPITFTYKIEFCAGDVKQIVGRLRRKGKCGSMIS